MSRSPYPIQCSHRSSCQHHTLHSVFSPGWPRSTGASCLRWSRVPGCKTAGYHRTTAHRVHHRHKPLFRTTVWHGSNSMRRSMPRSHGVHNAWRRSMLYRVASCTAPIAVAIITLSAESVTMATTSSSIGSTSAVGYASTSLTLVHHNTSSLTSTSAALICVADP